MQEKLVVTDSEESLIDSDTDSNKVNGFNLHYAVANDNNDQDNNNVQDFIWKDIKN